MEREEKEKDRMKIVSVCGVKQRAQMNSADPRKSSEFQEVVYAWFESCAQKVSGNGEENILQSIINSQFKYSSKSINVIIQ